MAVYAVGDIQGCYEELRGLLALIQFDPQNDRLWFVGDLVNRGPKSLETLRFVRDLGEVATTVLGNHDLHLIAAAYGKPLDHEDHTLDAILAAPDRDDLIDWLRSRPLLHDDASLGYTLVHAGLPPQWDRITDFLRHLYGNKPKRWSEDLAGWDRLRFIVNCLTRMRYCDLEGRLKMKPKGPPGSQPAGLVPWYELPGRVNRDLNIIFGHWSTLGVPNVPGIYPIDSGCLWGGQLTALRIDTGPTRISLPCPKLLKPG
jgi:bis(5'-nucleosyl)-tetraphosphatase (symmetrical)